MALSYNKLFVLMKEKGLTTYVIRKENIISQSALTSLKNGKSVDHLRHTKRKHYIAKCLDFFEKRKKCNNRNNRASL